LSQWLLTQPWIAYSEELPSAPPFGAWCLPEESTFNPNKLIIPDLIAIRQAVESGFGFSVLPDDYLCADWVK
jgi:DNA-binding transcriptional LysR family regulator